MDIPALFVGRDHLFIRRHMCQQPQLDLRVIRIHEEIIRTLRNESLTQLPSQLHTDGDVLQVRVCTGQTPGGRDRLLETAVDLSIFRMDAGYQTFDVGAVQLGQLPVPEHIIHDGIAAL